MRSPFGWDLPAGAASDPRAPWNAQEHYKGCPQHEDADEVDECGGHNEQDCVCADIAEQIESDAAEAAYERSREGI